MRSKQLSKCAAFNYLQKAQAILKQTTGMTDFVTLYYYLMKH